MMGSAMRRNWNSKRIALVVIAILMSPRLALAQDAEEEPSKTGVFVTMTVQQGTTSARALEVLRDISENSEGVIVDINQGGLEDSSAKIIASPTTSAALLNAIMETLRNSDFQSIQMGVVSPQDAESLVDTKRYENISVRIILKSQGNKLNRQEIDAFNEMTIGHDIHQGGGEFSMMVADADEVQKSVIYLSAKKEFHLKSLLDLEEYFRKKRPLGNLDLVVTIPGTIASKPLPAIPRRLINDPVANVFFLKQLDVTAAAETIKELIPRSRTKPNVKLNSLWVETDIESMREITALLNEIDSPAPDPFLGTKDPFSETNGNIAVGSSDTSLTPTVKASHEPIIREPFSIFTLHNLSFEEADSVIKKLLKDSVRVSHYPNHKNRMIAAGTMDEMQQLSELMKRIDPDSTYLIMYRTGPVDPQVVTDELRKGFPELSFRSDVDGTAVIAQANKHQHTKIVAIVERLVDRESRSDRTKLSIPEPGNAEAVSYGIPPVDVPIGVPGPPHIPLGAPATGLPGMGLPETELSVNVSPRIRNSVTPDAVRLLRTKALRAETAIKAVAQLKAQEKDTPSEEKRTAITRVVAEAFDVKQKLHQAELNSLDERLERMKTLMEQREQSKQKIIDRKVDEMMNPSLRWEAPRRERSTSSAGPGVHQSNPTAELSLLDDAIANKSASRRSRNFIFVGDQSMLGLSPSLSKLIVDAEVQYRLLNKEWFGTDSTPLATPCRIDVKVGTNVGIGGSTQYTFTPDGRVGDAMMHLQGPIHSIDSSLRHEVMHLILAAHFKATLPRWIDEGIAELHVSADELNKLRMLSRNAGDDRRIPLSQLFQMQSYPDDVLMLHSQGLSIVQFLINQGGKRKLIDCMKSVDPRAMTTDLPKAIIAAYGFKDVDDLEAQWIKSIGNVDTKAPSE